MYAPTPSVFDRLLAPATRLMARLRFGQKAMVIGATMPSAWRYRRNEAYNSRGSRLQTMTCR